jgi:hypothetical protein
VPTKNSDGSVTLSTIEYVLVLDVLRLAKELCLDMGAADHRDNESLVEVRLLKLVEGLEATGFRAW